MAAIAGVALASCSDSNFVGDENVLTQLQEQDGAIRFSSGFNAVTKADHTGADAADKLNNRFYVVAFTGDGSTMAQTFDNYLVEWTQNTAGTTESNTSDWEYVGKTAPAWSGINGNSQTIKYWDYSKAQYDFIAWSPGTATAVTTELTSGQVKITAPTASSYAPTYTLQGARDDLAKCYIADMVTAYKASSDYQKEVSLTFRNLACKVRVALYETVPGYSVKDVKFYTDASTSIATGASLTDAYLFTTGSTDKDNFYTAGTYTVSFPTIGSSKKSESDYNKAHVTFVATSKDTKEGFGALNKVGKEYKETDATDYLGRTLPTASYAGTAGDNYYKTMLPNEEGTVLELRVDYTLLATDGSGETINIHGATAYVPANYAQWKPNYAYTYIFKISDNTNGWTSTTDSDPAGLYPITFDAVVTDSEDGTQSTITTVATPSITTYQRGHNVTNTEYAAGDIYVQVMTANNELKSDLGTNGQLYTVTAREGKTITEADVMDALNIVASTSGDATTGRNGWVLTKATSDATITTIPGADGNNITVTAGTAAKFAASASTTYAYVYYTGTDNADTYIYSAVALTEEPADWSAEGVWYKDSSGSEAVGSYSDGTYYKKYTNQNKVYGVKVIKVQ